MKYKPHNADSDKNDAFILYQTCFLETQSGVLGLDFCFHHENVACEKKMIQLNLSLVQWNTGRVFPVIKLLLWSSWCSVYLAWESPSEIGSGGFSLFKVIFCMTYQWIGWLLIPGPGEN